MPHAADCIMTKLGPTYGYKHRDDVLLDWLQAQTGVTSDDLHDAWMELFDQAAIPVGSLQDRMFAWLGAQGSTELSLGDRWNDYWCNIHV